jgi:hypothetical protein
VVFRDCQGPRLVSRDGGRPGAGSALADHAIERGWLPQLISTESPRPGVAVDDGWCTVIHGEICATRDQLRVPLRGLRDRAISEAFGHGNASMKLSAYALRGVLRRILAL